MSAPPAEAFGVAAPSTRRPPPPGRAANATTNLPLPADPPWNRHDLPKVATAVPRMPNLPLASAPMSEDTAAGHEPPAWHGLAGGRLRRRSGYPPHCAQRPGANGPSEERSSEEPTPSTDLTCRANPPLSENSGRFSRQTTFPLYLAAPSGPVRLLRRTANGHFGSGERSAVTLARAGSMFRFLDPYRQLEKADSGKFSVHKSRRRTQFLHRFSTEPHEQL
jgi:hypothetical protein